MHACCTFITTPKLPFHPNVNPASKSSHHKDFEAGLTFEWFGDVFLSMSVQKLAIWANPISTFYKVGFVGLAKQLHPATTHNTQHTTHNTQHTTHNTQHTTHNTQHTTTNQNDPLLSYPPAALPSIAMATFTMAQTLGRVSSHKSMQSSCRRFWQHHSGFLCLEHQHKPHKIEH